jgi:hypothetical protein
MSPNCMSCDYGEHDKCIQDRCQCGQRDHQDVGTDTPQRAGGCMAALNLEGEHFWCDLDAGHDGPAHSSKAALAIWSPVPGPALVAHVALTLAAHRFGSATRVDLVTSGQVVTCLCGWSTVRAWADPVGSRHTHEQHVAAVLTEGPRDGE